jgi:UDP-glucuronate 4-epimerase
MAGVRPSIEAPGLYVEVNIDGTVAMLEAMKRNGCKRLVFASSSSVYGNNKKVPFSEEDSVDNPISPYAATKKAGELLCYTYSSLHGINTACLRFFTVYGPRQRPDLAIRKFARLMMAGGKIPFYGDGTTARDYTYVDDTVEGVVSALGWTGAAANHYDIFNLGNDNAVTLDEMVDALARAIGVEPKLDRLPMQPGDVDITWADISKARDVLGYDPKTPFTDGISKFVEWATGKA